MGVAAVQCDHDGSRGTAEASGPDRSLHSGRPHDHDRSGHSRGATLPFSFTFSGVHDWPGREFTSARTTVCKDIKVRWDFPEETYHQFKVSLRGSPVTVPTDGVARSYCWSGVPTNTIMQFRYYSTNNSGGDIAKASGSGQVRYP